ncbi:MAG: glutamine-hydrolyzing carbamoyl-phosphate synthase small subunit [Candidatus Diapherotrites archaeon]|uniref:Carbamoyl phosphate synthase small chain n=1 Tax=Candidatus Iainarchaeum sp. TaxID=3101447 RepID=A0A7J4ITL3_9ARCH|nr:MAG: carbamoyl-phosphate synthase small subunit [archaeon GW2011_AR10]MBS3059090.1 glutamine-hydrolyzing carbamoyl-phosphate synthase small subunit [Candidatus Diapherotrites archaeon]HIH08833.1 glutamine-hydrolyzing carbamoyl-phosphate synthase small subunit [Candidatus Diapherotrites archaeon]
MPKFLPKKAELILEDGSVFEGLSFGAEKSISGEVVFNTGMVGYPESLSDPSYRGQILVLSYPLIGNYGVPPKNKTNQLLEFFESDKIQVSGLIVSNYSFQHNHWNSVSSLAEWLKSESIPALTGIDTRALTQKLREKGVMLGKIVFSGQDLAIVDPNKRNLVQEVSVSSPVVYGEKGKKVMLVDCGAKGNIVRCLLERKVQVIRVPWDFNPFDGEFDFDGLLISNGPGDPKTVQATIRNAAKALEQEIPTFGICLGNQVLALAAGANTYKLKYGHRSQNQPAELVGTKQCFITSQNHGYAVDAKSLPAGWMEWFRNANDGSNEGIRHKRKPFMSVQFHPEATPGPTDCGFLFDEFLEELK